MHSEEEELSEESYSFQCEICFAKFPTKRSVSAHKRIHKANEKTTYTHKVNNLLTRNLMQMNQSNVDVPHEQVFIENIQLPPITGPNPTTLPPFSSVFSIKS